MSVFNIVPGRDKEAVPCVQQYHSAWISLCFTWRPPPVAICLSCITVSDQFVVFFVSRRQRPLGREGATRRWCGDGGGFETSTCPKHNLFKRKALPCSCTGGAAIKRVGIGGPRNDLKGGSVDVRKRVRESVGKTRSDSVGIEEKGASRGGPPPMSRWKHRLHHARGGCPRRARRNEKKSSEGKNVPKLS